MTRGRKPLTAEQAAKLKRVADADDAWRAARKYKREEYLRKADEEIATYALVRDQAVYEAVRSGVAKSVVGRDGLGTTNPYAVNEAYERVKSANEAGSPATPAQRFSWGRVIGKNANAVYGWVLDATAPNMKSPSPVDPLNHSAQPGFWVSVDRANGVTTVISTDAGLLTMADGGFEELREWAVAHADEAGGVENA